METLSVSKFKATCLSVLEEIRTKKKRVCITKRGVPIAEIVPVDSKAKAVPLKTTVTYIGDIVSPADEEDWEARK